MCVCECVYKYTYIYIYIYAQFFYPEIIIRTQGPKL